MYTSAVIISAYNNPKYLYLTLCGYCKQDVPPDEIIIADDGSGDDVRQVVDSFRDVLPIKHVWHEDNGFRKSEILNKALLAAESDYLIFTDQDCIPRKDFVATHLASAKEGCYISGGYYRLTMPISTQITKEDVDAGRPFDVKWLIANGQPRSIKMARLLGSNLISKMFNRLSTARDTWNGCNSSGWRRDALDVNGYNELMHYGGQDREFGMRLVNNGIKPIQMRYSAIVSHLDHKRPYKTPETMEFNRNVMRNTLANHVVWTPYGVEKSKP